MDPISLLKVIPKEVAIQAYEDALQPAFKQLGGFAEETVKLLRLALFPVKGGAYLYDRLSDKLIKSIENVPPDNLIAPANNFLLPIVDRLLLSPDDSVISDLYIKLLSSGMDREQIGKAHPAFFTIIGQLSPDEALLISVLAKPCLSLYFKKTGSENTVARDEIESKFYHFNEKGLSEILPEEMTVHPDIFQYGGNLFTYISHLQSLGLLEYKNNPYPELTVSQHSVIPGYQFWFIKLSSFGQMFYDVCVGDMDLNETNKC